MTSDDKLMIAETIYLYAIGIDTKDFDLYGSILLTTSILIFFIRRFVCTGNNCLDEGPMG